MSKIKYIIRLLFINTIQLTVSYNGSFFLFWWAFHWYDQFCERDILQFDKCFYKHGANIFYELQHSLPEYFALLTPVRSL